MKIVPAVLGISAFVTIAACSDDGSQPSAVEVDSVAVIPASVTIAVGDTVRLQATALNSAGVPFTGPSALWSSENDVIASVSPTGLVTGVSVGTAQVLVGMSDAVGAGSVTVTSNASIVLSNTAIDFLAMMSTGNPTAQSVTVTNGGDGSMGTLSVGGIAYGDGQPTGWLSTSLSGGVITLRALISGLAEGTYTAQFPVRATRATNSPQTVDVTLVVVP